MISHESFESDMPIEALTVLEVEEAERGNRIITVMDNCGNYGAFELKYTRELASELSDVRSELYNCKHLQTEIRARTASNGREMVAHQCIACGDHVGKFLKKEFWPLNRRSWDESIEVNRRARIDEALKPVFLKHIELQQQEADRYSAYLFTPQWRNLRQRVLDRDNGTCQGCLVARAHEVHHLTYRNIFNEFAFQLVSLCELCHDRFHGGEDEQR